MSKHRDFILMPIDKILKEAVSATNAVGFTIKAYLLYDYIMQSVFIKMTGFQEQKLKCIVWELATDDYEYRYRKLTDKLGECSNYKDKNEIYKDMIKAIKEYTSDSEIKKIFPNKKDFMDSIGSNIFTIFNNSHLANFKLKSFKQFSGIWNNLFSENSLLTNNLFHSEQGHVGLINIYQDHLYKARNRIAHNTLSYQQNLPTLKVLKGEDYKYENYFLWFAILVLIDEVFLKLYKKYLEVARQ